MTQELLPCPFCGGPPMLHSYHEAEGRAGINRIYWVTCDQTKPNHCQAALGVPVCNRQSEAEAIAAWNRRPAPPADGWLPIETAPKDGTDFLAIWAASNICAVVSWYGEAWAETSLDIPISDSPPTHWQPLPSPPGAAPKAAPPAEAVEAEYLRKHAKLVRELGTCMSPGSLAATMERRADALDQAARALLALVEPKP